MQKEITLNSDEEARKIFGKVDENLRHVEQKFEVRLSAQNNKITVSGEAGAVEAAFNFLNDCLEMIRSGGDFNFKMFIEESDGVGNVKFLHKGRLIKPKSRHQADYVKAIDDFDLVVSIGPAGTGKTYLAVAQAVEYLKTRKVERIIMTRPAVEAGESLGFLPGNLYEKINPYLRPIYDALYEMLEFNQVAEYIQKGVIEIAPLAYMRGRTLNDSFIILDEAQNTTHEQMKMFITRLGFYSKTVITGDITQVDLPKHRASGLVELQNILEKIEGIKFCYMDEHDVVRHELVKEIIQAYEKHEKKRRKKR